VLQNVSHKEQQKVLYKVLILYCIILMKTQVVFFNLHIHLQTIFSNDTKDMGLPMMSAHPLTPSRTMNYLPLHRRQESMV
jgi:hypothetical protein